MVPPARRRPAPRPRFHGPVPIYVQLANVLRERLRGGELRPGDQLPSEGALAREFGVSRITLRQAVDRLVVDGLVIRARGRPSTVARPGATPARTRSLSGSLDDDFRGLDRMMRVKVIDRRRERASELVAARLGVARGGDVVRIERAIRYRGEPLARSVVWLPTAIGDQLDDRGLEDRTLVALLSERHGIHASRSRQTIEATLADTPLARLLDVPVGAPILRVRGLYVTEDGRVISYAIIDYRADRYVYTVTMR